MKIFFLILFFIHVFAACVWAGSWDNKTICGGSSIEIGDDGIPGACYAWTAAPADPAIVNLKTAKIIVTPTQATTYTRNTIGQDFATSTTNQVTISILLNPAITITWLPEDYSTRNTDSSSTTVEKPFVIEYEACADVANNVWRLRVKKITGGVTIVVRTGGSRDPFASPPVSQAEAVNAVTDMKGYYARGYRGTWHTEAASKTHELHHYKEWKCSSEHFWSDVENCLEQFTVPYDSYNTEAAAVTALKALGADAKITQFKDAARLYWFTLGDGASDRPYAAGQLTLNAAIIFVQNLAAMNGWVVPAGTDTPSDSNPCYQPFTALVLTCP